MGIDKTKTQKNRNEKVASVLCEIILIFAIICLAFLCWNALFTRAFLALNATVEGENAEHVRLYSLNPVVQLLIGGVVLAALLVICLLIKRGLNGKGKAIVTKLPYICAAATFVLGIIYISIIKYTPLADSQICCDAAMQMIRGDGPTYFDMNMLLEYGMPEGYMAAFPFQLGYVLLIEIVFRIFGANNVLALQIINLFMVCAGQLLLSMLAKKISDTKFAELAGGVTAVLSCLCLPWLMYIVFCYGNIPSATFVLAACFSLCCFCRKPRVITGVWLILFSTAAMVMKASALISLIAFAIVLILMAIREKNAKILILVVLLLIPYHASDAVTAFYEVRCGMPLAPGTPKTAWIAMGLEDTSGFQPGGFNGRSYSSYRNNGMDYEATNREQIEMIQERLHVYADDPSYAAKFFFEKTEAQWLDPSFGAIFIGWAYSTNRDTALLNWEGLFNPTGWLWSIQSSLQWCVFLLAMQWGILSWKRIKPGQLPAYLTFLGGFLYLMISEAKAQYAISYYILLLPYAACALAVDANYISTCLQIKLSKKGQQDANQE